MDCGQGWLDKMSTVAMQNGGTQTARAICGAKTRTGEPCKGKPIVGGNGRCRMHNGRAAAGIAVPTYRHGRYSKYLPARLIERYNESAADNDLLALRDDIALLDARLADIIKRVDSGESGTLWRRLSATCDDLDRARRANDGAAIALAVNEMYAAIRRGIGDYAVWEEISRIVDQRRKLVESERKRLVEMQQLITSDQAMTLLAAVQVSIKTHVDDPVILRKIADDMRRLASVS
jgi:hypothetical protein